MIFLDGQFSFLSCAPAHFIRLLSSSPMWLPTHFSWSLWYYFYCELPCTIVRDVVPSKPMVLGRVFDYRDAQYVTGVHGDIYNL